MSRTQQISRTGEVFGSIITRLRVQRGWMVYELAKVAGLDRTYVGRIEHGENNPTLSVILRLAKALGVQASELVREVESQTGT